jgi:toxin-antitoxin system PIN domain toxin
MNHLLDVNFLLACAWQTHQRHAAANAWLGKQQTFATCPISQLGFLRVSMSPAFRADFSDALVALDGVLSQRGTTFIPDDLPAADIAPVTGYADTTDAYLVALAKAHGLKLATLDDALCRSQWAMGTAVNPLRTS